ncbi:MAG: hypothetical protein PHY43_12410 [Verrucomicrobiales bacterium]|nr:hypothetical protein [Verrucomicrobiales bacterium]
MNPVEIIGEICTADSAFIRGWRWLFSARYRASVREACRVRRPLLVVAGVLETLLIMAAEIVAIIVLVRWLVGL